MRTLLIPELRIEVAESPEEIALYLASTPKVLAKCQKLVAQATAKDVVADTIMDALNAPHCSTCANGRIINGRCDNCGNYETQPMPETRKRRSR